MEIFICYTRYTIDFSIDVCIYTDKEDALADIARCHSDSACACFIQDGRQFLYL